jgi:hypothetical protein
MAFSGVRDQTNKQSNKQINKQKQSQQNKANKHSPTEVEESAALVQVSTQPSWPVTLCERCQTRGGVTPY